MNTLSKLFTRDNIRILEELSKKDELDMNEIAESTSVSPNKVHEAIHLFQEVGIIQKREVKNKIFVSYNRESALLKKIRSLLNIFEISGLEEFKKLLGYGIVGVYGSFAKGEDRPDSDIDIWLCPSKKSSPSELVSLTKGIENHFGKEVELVIFSREDLDGLREKEPEFYFKIKFTSITFNGNMIELKK